MPKKKKESSEKAKEEPKPAVILNEIPKGSNSACITEDGKINAVVFKLVAESNAVTKDAPTLWSLIDILTIDQEEYAALPNFLEDNFGPGLYHLYQSNFDKIFIQNIEQMKTRVQNDMATITSLENARKLQEKKITSKSHGFD